MADTVVVPPGYTAEVLYAWGDPISDGPAFRPDASNTVADQERQAGMHHDGLHFFPLPAGSTASSRGLLATNHEYTDDGLLHVGGMAPWTAEKVAKSQAAHGVSVVEVALVNDRWTVVRPSRYARRVTAPDRDRLRRARGGPSPTADRRRPRRGATALGTINNCAHGVTPWGTYLACEENFNGYFVNESDTVPPRAAPVRDHQDGLRLSLARARCALRRRAAPERAEPLRLGRRDRPLRSGRGRP